MLLTRLEQDIRFFLGNAKDIFFNEADLQLQLAIFLQQRKFYNKIYLEYYVPGTILKNQHNLHSEKYKWFKKNNDGKTQSPSNINVDIVVQKNGLYIPIELKYKHKQSIATFDLFSSGLPINIIKEQQAKNNGCYAFWKDVRRIEILRNSFQKVPGGFAIFLSNKPLYKNKPIAGSNHQNFSMEDRASHGPNMNWLVPKHASMPDFRLDTSYTTNWTNITMQSEKFFYCLVRI